MAAPPRQILILIISQKNSCRRKQNGNIVVYVVRRPDFRREPISERRGKR